MIDRPFWKEQIVKSWESAPIVWLTGVRRVGKTTLTKSINPGNTQYFNCDLPVTAQITADPDIFFQNLESKTIIFDEIHQLPDPSRILKIGADKYPDIKILATGSSTLAASKVFRDSLTGRKRTVHLAPVLFDEITPFGTTLLKRLFHGGLPQVLLADDKDPGFYREWLDSFFARDIQNLFKFRDAGKFNLLFELLIKQSGGQFEVTGASREIGVTRPTIDNHLAALETTNAIIRVRPFHSSGKKEILKMPKLYAFDTGFVSYARGWDPLRPEDYGALWEHIVLDYLRANANNAEIKYWRDKEDREIDFVIERGRGAVEAIECKWSANAFDPTSLRAFREKYPKGANYVVCPTDVEPYEKQYGELRMTICNPIGWKNMAIGSGLEY